MTDPIAPITFKGKQTATTQLATNGGVYVMDATYRLKSASLATGIDSTDTMQGGTITVAGKIQLTATGFATTGIDLDLFDQTRLVLTDKASIAAGFAAIDAVANDGPLAIVNKARLTASQTGSWGVSAANTTGILGSLTLTNSGTMSGDAAGLAIWDDGAEITNSGTITGTSTTAGALGAGILLTDLDPNNDLVNSLLADTTLFPTGPTAITNSGEIAGAGGGDAIRAKGITVNLANRGTVTGHVVLGEGDDRISNSGSITGNLVLSDGRDVVINRGTITGGIDLGIGDDRFVGTRGSVSGEIRGGQGDDIYVFGQTVGLVVENASEGHDTIVATSTVNLTSFVNIEDVILTGGLDGDVIGNVSANRLVGNAGRNTMNGNEAADTMSGGGGNDIINGDDGLDQIDGEAGNDTLSGGFKNDALLGGDGDDLMSGDNDADTMSGGNGNDTIYGDDIAGLATSASFDDTLRGDAGNDTLLGGAGDDWLDGGTGNDALSGGLDGRTDVFVFVMGTGVDTITDFEDGNDVIDLSGFTGAVNLAALSIVQVLGDSEITLIGDTTDKIIVKGILTTQLTAGDFDFAP